MTTRTPLTQNPGTRVYHVHEMCIRLVQIARIIWSRIEKNRRIQSGNASQLSLFRPQMVGHKTGDVSTDAVTDKVHIVGQHAARMPRQVFNQLRNAQTAEARRPFHLAETWLLHQATIVDDNDVVVAALKVRVAYVRAGIVVAAATKAVYDDFGRMRSIEVRVVKRLGVKDVYDFGLLLGAPRVEIKLDAGMWTAIGFLDARSRCEWVCWSVGCFFCAGRGLGVC